ncbi:hypothetical protein NP233_g11257 [Leucocoprinus birnbaumii]|uniref:Uncharacterized protein n=1 Tax=Leucocoprinus birnbaumii TaxID=56174 RepID=A0AAD5VH97_9AGAR|nr:hypothetical protein NP233_g11257 [Leucocoprinus birnbaumii]
MFPARQPSQQHCPRLLDFSTGSSYQATLTVSVQASDQLLVPYNNLDERSKKKGPIEDPNVTSASADHDSGLNDSSDEFTQA